MKKLKTLILIITACFVIGKTSLIWASSVNDLLQSAREKKSLGDLAGAAAAYQEILKIENHQPARQELAEVLIDAQIRDPDTEAHETLLLGSGT